jgi:hypothetical protein
MSRFQGREAVFKFIQWSWVMDANLQIKVSVRGLQTDSDVKRWISGKGG